MTLRRRRYLSESVDDESLFDAMYWYAKKDKKLFGWFIRLFGKETGIAVLKRHFDEDRRGGKLRGMTYEQWLRYKIFDSLENRGYGIARDLAKPFLKKIQMGPPKSMIRKQTTHTPDTLVALHKKEGRR